MKRLLAIALLLAAIPGLARAQSEPRPVIINGVTYGSWSEYFQSDYFRENGLRCGTRTPALKGRPSLDAGPADCGMETSNPSDEYEPSNTVYTITVVVHRLESVTGDGVYPDSMVTTQIEIMNEDFRALAGTPGEPGYDTRVQFRLATEDPDGNPHPGWTRTTNEFWFNDVPDPVLGNYWDNLAWDTERYLNIYTMSPVAPGGVILGYVQWFPAEGAGLPDDGVRILWNAFGRNSSNAPYNQGRTATHEVGHYLGLYHVFQDGCGTATRPGCYQTGDLICDTEPDANSHGGCPVNANTCGDPDPIRNYMEYTDDLCMNNFTQEQARRIRCSIEHYRPLLPARSLAAAGDRAAAPAARLAQNRPNPFAGSTRFEFELPGAGPASLVVLDLAGRRVRTLVAGTLAAGRHQASWDGTDDDGRAAAPGTYFYKLVSPEGTATRRLVRLN